MAPWTPGRASAAFSVAGLATAFLVSRYYTSGAFERPIHFSTLTMLTTAALARAWFTFASGQTAQYQALPTFGGHASDSPETRDRRLTLKLLTRPLCLNYPLTCLLLCAVTRTLIFWRTIRTIHCSWDGVHCFLPFVSSIYSILQPQSVLLPGSSHENQTRAKWQSLNTYTYSVLALAWGIATNMTLVLTERRTGAIFPTGWPERMIPLAQLVLVICDATAIECVKYLRTNRAYKNESWYILSSFFLYSALILLFLALCGNLSINNIRWNIFLTSASTRDLVVDSIMASLALIAGIYLLGRFASATVGYVMIATAVLVHFELELPSGTFSRSRITVQDIGIGLVVLGTGALVSHYKPALSPSNEVVKPGSSRNRFFASGLLIFLILISPGLFYQSRDPQLQGIATVIDSSQVESERWIQEAKQSKSLDDAIDEYNKRYGIPPPPHFDKWYEYAISVASPIIDNFNQIDSDLRPYWGIPPVIIRDRTTHLLEHPKLSVGGLIITNGQVQISPLIQGTHRWMMEVTARMVQPFAQWLPDMQLAFNLNDECRVSIPFHDLEAHRKDGRKSRATLAARVELHEFSPQQNPPWSNKVLTASDAEGRIYWKSNSKWFQNWSKSLIFYQWVSSTCPTNAAANRFSWWNRKADCLTCAAPHMTNGVVSKWTLSGDLCHQPDLAYLHGFLIAPSSFVATHELFPIFSQSRAENFADVLYPSPWNFGDKVIYEEERDILWESKLNSMFWRGAASDGYATHGAWQTFLRARFVSLSHVLSGASNPSSPRMTSAQALSKPSKQSALSEIQNPVAINVSFVDKFGRCDQRDCAAELTTFYGSRKADGPSPTNFQEHWRHRHLIDLDGAGFSGRFLPFLQSTSLPYRTALFRTWWEERVHPWKHFVPIDVRLNELWRVVGYFGGQGDEEAKKISNAGREWAKTALRKEDMQVYMFRLLLEWGRLVDDRREELGFVPK